MNHALSVYTVIYVAILFVTVSIWGGDVKGASGDVLALLLAQGAFSLKLAIDDYVHFHKVSAHVARDLAFSLLMYLVLAASLAYATTNARIGAWLFGAVFAIGIAWLVANEFWTKSDDRSRRIGWFLLNIVNAGLLGWAGFLGPRPVWTTAALPLLAVVVLVVVDFIVFGTLKRLAECK